MRRMSMIQNVSKFLTLILFIATATASLGISKSRVIQIQKALNKHGYAVAVTGKMDCRTTNALRQLQKDNHWQHKRVPDSRALIYLDLGPKYNKLLNPDTAWIPKNGDK